MEDETIETEQRKKESERKTTFFDVIFFPFKLLGTIFSHVFNFIKIGVRIILIIILIFFIWFGYNFYITFSDLEERGVGRQEAVIEAFTITFNKTKNGFSNIYGKIPAFFTNEYSDKEGIREIFIETRGIPEVYVIMISYDEIKDGIPIKRSSPLRFEVWSYGNPHNEKVSFENGFFKEKKGIIATDEFIENNISPLFFNTNTTKKEVQGVFGLPSCIITEQAGEDTLTTYRFKETEITPLAAVTFVNEKIIAVSSGIIFLGDNEDSLCK
jgi:hypothetical protein